MTGFFSSFEKCVGWHPFFPQSFYHRHLERPLMLAAGATALLAGAAFFIAVVAFATAQPGATLVFGLIALSLLLLTLALGVATNRCEESHDKNNRSGTADREMRALP